MRGPSKKFNLKITKRITPFRVCVNDALVKDKAIVLVLGGQPHLFQRLISVKVIGICHRDDVCGFLVLQGSQDMVFHAFIVQYRSPANVQCKTSHFTAKLAPDGAVPVIFGTAGDKLFNGVAIQLVGHFAKEITRLYLGLTRAPGVDDGVCVVVENVFL